MIFKNNNNKMIPKGPLPVKCQYCVLKGSWSVTNSFQAQGIKEKVNTQQPVNLAFVYKGKTVVEKTFWTPYAFVMDCIALRIRLRSPSAVYFSVVAFPHFRRLSKTLD